MKRFLRTVYMAAVVIVAASLIVVAAQVISSAWVSRQPWLNPLWLNVSFILHREWFAVPLVALIYVASFLFVRWHLIAWPNRRVLLQQIGDLRLRLALEAPGDPEKERKIGELRGMLDRAAARVNRVRLWDRILWSRGQELANTRHVSEVERELSVLQPHPRVKARLETAEQELREIPTKNASALADAIHAELAGSPGDERIRCLLYEALGIIYSRRDDDNDNLLTWHNKTLWMTGLGILILISLEGVKRGGGGLFVVGAAGGFMSRLMRTLRAQDVPTDYNAYWTTLFLSPLLGALAGWTGILLIELSHTLGVLGEVFKGVTVQFGYGNLALGLAFLLGFSERLFYGILKPIEDGITKKAQPGSSSSSAAPAGSSSSGSGSSAGSGSSSSVSSRGPSASAASSSSLAHPSSSGSSSSSAGSGSGSSVSPRPGAAASAAGSSSRAAPSSSSLSSPSSSSGI
jgi:hypothetical protein